MTVLFSIYMLVEEIPMSNLRDIETLEILSVDELNHVVGGRGRGLGGRWGKSRRKWFDCGEVITTQTTLDSEVLFPNTFEAFETFLTGLIEVESIDEFSTLQEGLMEDLQDAVI